MEIEKAAKRIHQFEGESLTDKLFSLEVKFRGLNRKESEKMCEQFELNSNLIASAFEVKKLAAQIHIVIHTIGILAALPSILDDDEHIEYLSLGAGNTGRKFDLETNKRIAEFKFINWRGGADAIRQNSLFKDFYELAEYESSKKRYLYTLGVDIPFKFFNGYRSLESVLSHNNKLFREFSEKYVSRFKNVNDYYQYRKNLVEIVDISRIIPELIESV
ncbi:MAG: hypothetical protein WC496_05090 [Phycisphaerae bacterium]|jgi:hypothetical protein